MATAQERCVPGAQTLMTKRPQSLTPEQLAFSFDMDPEGPRQGSFADVDQMTAAGVSRILKEDPRNRFEIAADLSELFDADISKWMLDAWSSPARDAHKIGFTRMVLLAATTGRADVLNALLRPFGFAVVAGEEILLLEYGHLQAQQRARKDRLRDLGRLIQPINREGRRK